ncbi:OmpA family protein [Pedobacter caeni]|uniref:OmpA family protein n=1 Tax=Pedobacter caeni TaxID=288992 RepID=A0A1M5PU10_9SPHI|nr:OmpA family protein [Pedobacter caeni]SHH05101.1 OmpA family protein [Pedobacter caeni]
MIKTTYTLLTTALLWGFCGSAGAQEQPGLREKADRLFQKYQYANAAAGYLKLVDVKKPRLKDMERLAVCYRKMNNFEDAETWYSRIIASPESNSENLILYGEVLKTNAKYEQAKKVLQEYATKTGKHQSVANELAGCDSAQVWMANPTAYKLRNEAAVNTQNAEFAAFPHGSTVYYAGEPATGLMDKIYGWTGNSYLKIFTAESGTESNLSNPLPAINALNTERYHVGPVTGNKAGDVLFITRTYPGNKGEINKENKRSYKTNTLELFIQKKVNGEWQNAEAFPYNKVKAYSVGHAALSTDEKTLYFVSDMPGGLGGTDIWYCNLNTDGSWSVPVNAGSAINTAANELFPAIGPDGTLFYSTSGLPGMGGLDIFSSKGAASNWSKPQNLKFPLNSAADDFAFVVNEANTAGFISSNRKGGKGNDDIYSFSHRKAKIILALTGITYNKKTGERLPAAAVTLFSNGRTIVGKQSSKADGTFFFELETASDYKVLATKEGFYADSASLSTVGMIKSDTLSVALNLNPLFEKGKILRLENIHYDFDKANIRPDAAKILDELVRTMRDNPTLKIELGSHTDSRGVDIYNLDLSQRRATSAVNYLVSRGISRDRMTAKGYGEQKLLNRCANGVACSVAEHQANRRTEFKVLAY